jgi:hypothetical protein
MTYGTSYFTSLSAAVRYYKAYGYDKSDVQRKIREGEIHIGKPKLKPGERLGTTDGGKRYTISNTGKSSNPAKGTWIKVKAIKFLGGGKIQVLK